MAQVDKSFPWKTRIRLSCIVNTMVVDGMATEGPENIDQDTDISYPWIFQLPHRKGYMFALARTHAHLQ